MGAWDESSFGNDDACDWAIELEEEEDGFAFIEETLKVALVAPSEYLEAPDASKAIAAAETVAMLKGNPGTPEDATEEVTGWVKSQDREPKEELVKLAIATIDRILEDNSELKDLWEEGESFESWKACIAELKSRLQS